MFYWKIAGGVIAGALLLFAACAIQRMHTHAEQLADCQAIAGGQLARTKGDLCPAVVVGQLQSARAASACDQGLAQVGADPRTWGAPLSCSPKIQNLVASHNAAWSTVADREQALDRLQSGQAAAIARAQARGVSQARSEANAQAAIDAAPRDAAGLIVCRDDCLRQLAGEAPAGGSAAARRGVQN